MANLKLLGAVGVKVRPDARNFRKDLQEDVRRELAGYEPEVQVGAKVDLDTRRADTELRNLERRIESANPKLKVKVAGPSPAELRDLSQAAQRVRIAQVKTNEEQLKYNRLLDDSKSKLADLRGRESYIEQPDGTKLRSDVAAQQALKDAQSAVRRAQRDARKAISAAEAEGRPTTRLEQTHDKRVQEAKAAAKEAARLVKEEADKYAELAEQVKAVDSEMRSARAKGAAASKKHKREVDDLTRSYEQLADAQVQAALGRPSERTLKSRSAIDAMKRKASPEQADEFRAIARETGDQAALDLQEHIEPARRELDELRKSAEAAQAAIDKFRAGKSRQWLAAPKNKAAGEALDGELSAAIDRIEKAKQELAGLEEFYINEPRDRIADLYSAAQYVELQGKHAEALALNAEMDEASRVAAKERAAAEAEAAKAAAIAQRELDKAQREAEVRRMRALRAFQRLIKETSTLDLLRNRSRVTEPDQQAALTAELNRRLSNPRRRFSDDMEAIRREADDTADHIENLDPTMQVNVSGALVVSRTLAWLSRTRVANFLVKVDSKSFAIAAGMLSSLSGFNIIQGFGSRFTNLAKNFDEIAVKTTAVAAGIAAMSNSTLWLTGSLANIAGGMSKVVGLAAMAPAGIAALGAVAVITGGAFKNFGEAIQGSDEHLAAIPPNAREAALALRGTWDAIQRPIQGNFWEAMGTSMQDAVKHVIPQFAAGLAESATGAGLFTSGVLRSFQKIAQNKQMEAMFKNLSAMFGNASNAAEPFFDALNRIGLRGSEFLPRFGTWLTDISKQFDKFITDADKIGADGKSGITRWIDEGIVALQDMWSVGGSVLDMFQGLAQAAELGGLPDLHDMRVEFRKIADLMLAEPFKSRMGNIFRGAYDGANELGRGIKSVGRELGESSTWVADIERNLGTVGGNLLDGFAKLFGNEKFQSGTLTAIQGMSKLVNELDWDSVGATLGEIGSVAGTLLENLGDPLNAVIDLVKDVTDILGEDFKTAIPKLTDTLTRMIEKATPFIEGLAGMVSDLAAGFASLDEGAQEGILGVVAALALLAPGVGLIAALAKGVGLVKGGFGLLRAGAGLIGIRGAAAGAAAGGAAVAGGAAGTAVKAAAGTAAATGAVETLGNKAATTTAKIGTVGGKGLLGALGILGGLKFNAITAGITVGLGEVDAEIKRRQELVDKLKTEMDPKTGQLTREGAKAATAKTVSDDGLLHNMQTFLGIGKEYKDTLGKLGLTQEDFNKKMMDPKGRREWMKAWEELRKQHGKGFGSNATDEQLAALGFNREQYDAAASGIADFTNKVIQTGEDIEHAARESTDSWANTAPIEAAQKAVEGLGLTFSEQDWKAYLDADPSRAERVVENAGDVAREFAHAQYLAKLDANNDPAMQKLANALNVGTEYANGDFEAVLNAFDAATPEVKRVALETAGILQPQDIKVGVADGTDPGLTAIQEKLKSWNWPPVIIEIVGQVENFLGTVGGWLGQTFGGGGRSKNEAGLQRTWSQHENGGILRAPTARAFLNGGIVERPGDAKIYAPATDFRVFAERATQGEAFIPMGANKRARSTQILSEVAAQFGLELRRKDVRAFENGGISGREQAIPAAATASFQIGQYIQHTSTTPDDVARALIRQRSTAPGGHNPLGGF